MSGNVTFGGRASRSPRYLSTNKIVAYIADDDGLPVVAGVVGAAKLARGGTTVFASRALVADAGYGPGFYSCTITHEESQRGRYRWETDLTSTNPPLTIHDEGEFTL